MSLPKTPKEKLDELLDITDGKSIDSFLSDMDINKISSDSGSIEQTFGKIEDEMAKTVENIDESLNQSSNLPDKLSPSEMSKIESNFDKISELVDISKNIITHLYNTVVTSDMIDSKTIIATANLISVARANVKEYIDFYKDRIKFYDKLRLEALKFQNKKELMELKNNMEIKKAKELASLNGKVKAMSPSTNPKNNQIVTFSQEEIIRQIDMSDNS